MNYINGEIFPSKNQIFSLRTDLQKVTERGDEKLETPTNMGKYTNKLVEIYAKYDIDKLSEKKEYYELCRENISQSLFNKERQRVEKIKRILEESVGKQSSTKNQVIEALRSLNRMNNEEEINLCYALIIKGYSKQWTQNQLVHFDKYFSAIKKNYDYFLSFTDRNPNPEYDNLINNQHKFLIKTILGKKVFEKANKKENLLARAIHFLLESTGNRKGFFYTQKPADNQEVKEKLINACEKCFVFIQLVQNIMFYPGNTTNYCYFEYCHACKCLAGERDFIFLLAEKPQNSLIKLRDVYYEYDKWYRDILDRGKITIEPTENYDRTHITRQLNKIRKDLFNQIEEIKWKIIENVPD